MTIRITHHPGVGDWLKGVTVDIDGRHANKLIERGYAVEVKEKKESARHVSTKSRSGV